MSLPAVLLKFMRLFSLALMLFSGLSITFTPVLAHSSTDSMAMSMTADMTMQAAGSLAKLNNNQDEISSNNNIDSDISCEDSCATTPCPASSCVGKIINVLPYYSAGSFSFITQLTFTDQIEYSSKPARIFHPPKY